MTAYKRINILFIHANNYDIGGSDYCLLKLVLTLDRSRFNPIVLLGLETEIADKYRKHGIPLMIVPMLRIRKVADPRYQLKFALLFIPTVLKIMKFIRKYKIDIVHSNDFLDLYGPIAARLTRVKSIQHDRLIMLRPIWLKTFLCYIIRKLNHRIAVMSDFLGREMFSVNGKTHPKVVTCYDWLDMDIVGHAGEVGTFRREIGVSEDASLIGVVGRLEPWKGQDVFVKAVAEVNKIHPEVRFVVVGGEVLGRGRERYRSELEELARYLKITEKIFFTGYRTDIMNIMDSLSIFVHSSVDPEPFGLVVMEAMSMGKPVIVPHEGGVLEQVVEGKTGLFYEPGNYYEMAKAICWLIEHPELAKRMGQSGKDRVYRIFNRAILCKRFESLYESMVGHVREV